VNPPADIPRIAPPSADAFYADFVRASRPVILRGAIADWPAMKKWSLDYFKHEFGDRQLPVVREKDGAQYQAQSGLHYEQIRFADYCDLIADGKPHDLYITVRVDEQLPELFDDIRQPAYSAGAPWTRSRFWLGASDTKGPLHRDLPENLYAQIDGRKQFLLLERRLTRMVHRHPFYSGVPNYSPVDAEKPDLSQFPRFRGAPLWRGVVEPGDLLYIPSLWWHQAHSLSTSISVNLWWLRGPKVAVARLAELYMRVRGLNL
jgi:lysine-specific demethylase 8